MHRIALSQGSCYLMFVDFLYNKLTLAILYHVVGTCDDREPLFAGEDDPQ